MASDPSLSLNSLAMVARGQALSQWQSNLSDQRARQWKQTGSVIVSESSSRYLKSNTFEVSSCIDVSKVNVIDSAGKSVLAADRPNKTKYTYEVTKTPDGFFVTQDQMKGSSC